MKQVCVTVTVMSHMYTSYRHVKQVYVTAAIMSNEYM